MDDPVEIQGHCDPRFAGVRDAFARNFADGVEVGASFAAFLDGDLVIDIWAGDRDAEGHPWEEDTIVNVYSTTKLMAAICTLMAADRGRLDLDAPVAEIWPEFAASGKSAIPTTWLLAHTSGVAGWAEPVSLADIFDWERSTALLAAQAPFWEPGTASGYHALTHGHLLGEVVRRSTGRSLGTFFREEVAGPLGADFHIGTPASCDPRLGRLVAPEASSLEGAGIAPGSVAARVLGNPPLRGEDANEVAWRRAEIPAANGHGNARSVARVAGALARGGELGGVRLLTEEMLARAMQEQSNSQDLVLGVPIRFGLGFGLTSKEIPVGPHPRTLFWGGWGGSLAVADLDARLGFAYVMNRMSPTTLGDTRAFGLAAALFGALD
jgi:CubicO group peptidase (beta-lactamase class C family)